MTGAVAAEKKAAKIPLTGPSPEMPVDEKPFRLAKSFSLVAIILIFATVMSLATVVSRQAEVIITKRVEDDTIKLMENLNHQMYEGFLKAATQQFGEIRLREPIQQAMLHEVITNTIYGFDIERVLIYDLDGRVVYATDQTRLTSDADDFGSFQKAIDLYYSTPWRRFVAPFNFQSWRQLREPETHRPLGSELNLPPTESIPPASENISDGQDGMRLEPSVQATDPVAGSFGYVAEYQMPNLYSFVEKPGTDFQVPEKISSMMNDAAYDQSPNFTDADKEDEYLEHMRALTIHRYEGGDYLFLNFFPRGNVVLRSYKAMELYQTGSLSGVLEINRDLTAEYRQIARLQYFALSVAAFLSLVLTIVLRWVVSRGEAIINKRNREQQALRSQLDQAERLAGLGSMVATVAHEIRNPLGIIHSTADVLNRFLRKDDPDKAKLAEAIVAEANRLSDVVTEFLDFARPPLPRPTPTVIEDILEEILAFLELTLNRAGVEVRTNFRRDQSPVEIDGPMIHRAVLNLLVNAIQAMDDGGLITITTRLEVSGDRSSASGPRLLVAISDTGPGLSEEAAHKMFAPFYTTKAKGTGLGLVIVHNIIKAHGGEIEIINNPPSSDADDESGPGLTVFIYLPVNGPPRLDA